MDNRPFSDQEKRFIVTEALRSSRVPIETMLATLDAGYGPPDFGEMLVPWGRTPSQCIATLNELRASHSPLSLSLSLSLSAGLPMASATKRKSGTSELLDPSSAGPTPKRRHSSTPVNREIQPRLAPNGDPVAHTTPPAATSGRKRGRPSRAILEQRHAEALARGEVLGPTPLGAKGRISSSGKLPPLAPSPATELPPLDASAAQTFGAPPVITPGLSDSAKKRKAARPLSRSGEGPSVVAAAPESMIAPEDVRPAERGLGSDDMGTTEVKREEITAMALQQPVSEVRAAERAGYITHTHPAPVEPPLAPEKGPTL